MASVPRSALVVGGGIVGLACALRLQRAGLEVEVSDPDCMLQAPSWNNAGHIASEQLQPLASPAMLRGAFARLHAFGGPLDLCRPLALAPWLYRYLRASTSRSARAGREALRPLMARALPAWRALLAELGTGALLRDDGHWLCWESALSAARGLRNWRAADTGSAGVELLDSDCMTALAGRLQSPPSAAIRFSGTAQLRDPGALAQALQRNFVASGGVRGSAPVARLRRHGGRVFAEFADGRRCGRDLVLVCAGIGSAPLMRSIGIRAPLVAERGYHLHWPQHDWPRAFPPVVFEDRSLIVTRFDNGLQVSGYVEFAPVDTPPDAGKWRRLQTHAEQLGLPVSGQPRRWFGARPTLPDYLPAIGRCADTPNLLYAFGHQHLGLTLAAVTAELVGAMLLDEVAPAQLEPFDLARFA
jgi:D-hydroxyproline dehydrogenase